MPPLPNLTCHIDHSRSIMPWCEKKIGSYAAVVTSPPLMAWGTWRQSPAAWWGLVAFQVFGLVNFLTLRSLDMAAYMKQAGYPDEQIRQAASMNILGSAFMLWIAVVVSLALLGFLVAIRRHFRGQNPSPG